MTRPIEDQDLVLHFLNVGFGDCCIIEFPKNPYSGKRSIGVVDCHAPEGRPKKPLEYLHALRARREFDRVEFVCATHPHSDHIDGIKAVLTDPVLPRPEEFWDAGFRYTSTGYLNVLKTIVTLNGQPNAAPVQLKRVSSGMETYHGLVRITALAPAVALRNRFATHGVNSNNASIVLRLQHCADDPVNAQSMRYDKGAPADPWLPDVQGRAVALLGGDAEFESWACIDSDYPHLFRDVSTEPLVTKVLNPLSCDLFKVSHHGSKDSAPLAVYSRSRPSIAVISVNKAQGAAKHSGGVFPHELTTIALKEENAQVYSTDGNGDDRVKPDGRQGQPGSVIAVLRAGRNTVANKLDDGPTDVPAIVDTLVA
jgi:beta-lactamase superfamily II metal-dependent hydrolase